MTEKTASEVDAFLSMRTWFDQLSHDERHPLEQLLARSGSHDRLLPLSHGPDLASQLDAAKKRFLEAKDPFCLVRIGDCEVALLGGGAILGLHSLPIQFKFSGLARESFPLRKDFLSAIQEAPLVGLQENWASVRAHTAALLSMMGLSVPLPTGVEVHLPYKLLVDGTLFRYLAGKKVLLVGAGAPRLWDCLGIKTFLDLHAFLGPLAKMKVAGVIPTRTREAGGAWVDYDRVLREAEKIDFDVALLACGAVAKGLAWRIWKTGRTALDVGFVFDALMGNPEREHRPVLKGVQWPKFP